MIYFRILQSAVDFAALSGAAAAEETPTTPVTHHAATMVRKVATTTHKAATHKATTHKAAVHKATPHKAPLHKAATVTHRAVATVAKPVVVDTIPMPALGPHAADPQDAYNTRSMADLQLAAQGGDLRAQYTLGMNYRAWTGTRSDLASAFKWQSQRPSPASGRLRRISAACT